jgi:hypothetical protein
MKTMARILIAVAASGVLAAMAGCTAQTGEEQTGSSEEAICGNGCSGGTSSGTSSGTGSSSGGYKPVCNPAIECCVESGGATIAQMNAQIVAEGWEPGTCAQDLANAGCGGLNAAGTAVLVGGVAPAVASFTWSTANDPTWVGPPETEWWFEVYCPSTSTFPASCLDYTSWYNAPPPEAAYCAKAQPQFAGYNSYDLDPVGGCANCKASANATQD